MDKLDKKQKETVSKMSTARLTAKLAVAGLDEEELETLTREQLLDKWAEIVIAGKTVPTAAKGADSVEIERERLQFEKDKFAAEAEEKKLAREAEKERVAAEKVRWEAEVEERRLARAEEAKIIAWERSRVEEEKVERKRREDAEAERAERHIKELQLANNLQREAMKNEKGDKKSVVSKLKQYGDAIRNSLSKMSDNPTELIVFFDSVEQLFVQLEIPKEFQVTLLKPYLNERALMLVNRLTGSEASDYELVKKYLMDQFRLCPQFFLESFNRIQRAANETYKSFIARLTRLLQFYTRSRDVTDFASLCQLLIVDRVKVSLTESALKHVISVESTATDPWLRPDVLSNVLDNYYANYQFNDKPRVSAIGTNQSLPYTSFSKMKTGQINESLRPHSVNDSSHVDNNGKKNVKPINKGQDPTGEQGIKRCWQCDSTSHLSFQCTVRPKEGASNNAKSAYSANRSVLPGNSGQQASRTVHGAAVNSVGSDTHLKVIVDDVRGPVNAQCNKVCMLSEQISNASSHLELNKQDTDNEAQLKLAQLHYLQVNILGSDYCWRALHDSGSEVDVIDRHKLNECGVPHEVVGSIALRPMAGPAIPAQLVKIKMCLIDSSGQVADYVNLVVAACDELHDELILSEPTVQRLIACQHRHMLYNDMSNAVNVDVNAVTRCMSQAHLPSPGADIFGDEVTHDVDVDNDIDNDEPIKCYNDDEEIFINPDKVQSIMKFNSGETVSLVSEQQNDETLKSSFALARAGKGGYIINNDLLFHVGSHYGQTITKLVVPKTRRMSVIKLAHNSVHWAVNKTKQRIVMSGLVWPTLSSDVNKYCGSCEICQLRARQRRSDKVPISVGEKAGVGQVFSHMHCDVFGPILPNQNVRFNYALIVVDSTSRYPFACPLSSLHSKNICDALMSIFEFTGICSSMVLTMDNASYFRSALTQEFLKRIGVSPLFSTEYHPEGNAIAERGVASLKNLIAKLAYDKQKSWTKYLGACLWAIRESVNGTTHVPPHLLVFGSLPRGPLTILKETWLGQRELVDSDSTVNTCDYLEELLGKLQTAQQYAAEHAVIEQARHVKHYNLRAKDKHFQVGDKCLILQRDSTSSSVFSRWKGPATVVQVCSPYSYMVELNGGRYHMHANNLRQFSVRAEEVECKSVSCDMFSVVDDLYVNSCNVIYESDVDFGELVLIDSYKRQIDDLLPSHRIAPDKLAHLSHMQREQLLMLLDKYPDVFNDRPGLCYSVQHEIKLLPGFTPKRLRAYRVPQHYREEVNRQVAELLQRGFIEPSTSPQASPLVVVLKQPNAEGHRKLRLAIDFRWVNKYTEPTVPNMGDIGELIQAVGDSNFISLFDANAGYHQTLVQESDRWLTSFVCELGQFQWLRTPFGMRNSGTTFVRALQQALQANRSFIKSYIDDMAVHSKSWGQHLDHIESHLNSMRDHGFTLGIEKCEFAKPQVKYIGHIIGSGERRVDPAKIDTINRLQTPSTKKQVRQLLGFFSFFREHIPNYAKHAKLLTDLTGKNTPERLTMSNEAVSALNRLKELLCRATMEPLCIIDVSKPFSLYVDSCDYAVGAVLTQSLVTDIEHGYMDYPVAFASAKLSQTQQRWAIIEKEAYAALWALQKFKHWLFGTHVTLYSDHNPITYLTETTPKSSKLVRWALALQEFNVSFVYRAGKNNEAADCISRMVYSRDECRPAGEELGGSFSA